MAWGFGGFRHGSKKKKKTKSYDSWFERHSSEQLKTLLKAASLPVSGTKSKQIERLLQCPLTNIYAPEIRGMNMDNNYITLEQIKARCREAKLSPGGSKFDLVLRLIENDNDANIRSNTTPSKSNSKKRSADSRDHADVTPGDCSESDAESVAPSKKKRKVAPATKKQNKSLEGEALEKRKKFRFQKLNKQIFDRLQWKASYKHMNGDFIKGGRVEIDCPEPEVFIAMFADDDECCEGKAKSMEGKLKGDTNGIKKASSGKLSRSFKTDDDVECSGLKGKTYRLGSEAVLKSPTSVSLHHGKLACSFKYTVM